MDYCSTCRRHLNGALVCPGCGAYAPDIAPLAVGSPAPAPETGATTWQAPAARLWQDRDAAAEEAGEEPQELPHDGPDAPSLSPTGRAARRRQRERWKKTQRRALVATAVALVGGGLTVASMDRQSTDSTQAASAPDTETMGIAEKPATDTVPTASAPTGKHRAKDTSSTAHSSTANAPHEQYATTPQATPTTPAAGQDGVADPVTRTISTAEKQASTTVSDTTDTVTETTASPTPSATDGTDTSGTDTSSTTPSSSDTSSSSSATSPSGLCVLGIVCIS